ncbi:MAG: hypothetical protein H6696_08815 [Deferribacteres bacterium]|nr:hypothetical protein [Deferribacteres bacterium]
MLFRSRSILAFLTMVAVLSCSSLAKIRKKNQAPTRSAKQKKQQAGHCYSTENRWTNGMV